jgi:hypothetical protein
MSDFTVVGDVGETLRNLLASDPWKGISPKPDVTLKSPEEIKADAGSSNKVSLFLYQIHENPHLRNEEVIEAEDSQLSGPPMMLDLMYLVTPYSDDKTQEKYILGKVMQIFHDHAVLSGTVLQGSLAGTSEEMRLLFNPLSLDDLTKIWSAFQDVAYRLSAGYMVTPVKIDSTRVMNMQRVVLKEMNHAFMIPKAGGE